MTTTKRKRPRKPCAACNHDHCGKDGRCNLCSCYGYWPEGASVCANPRCPGLNCSELRQALKEAP